MNLDLRMNVLSAMQAGAFKRLGVEPLNFDIEVVRATTISGKTQTWTQQFLPVALTLSGVLVTAPLNPEALYPTPL